MKKGFLIVVSLLMALLCSLIFNKTFFKTEYNGIKIPLFSFYINENTLYNIRNYNYLDDYKNNYLDDLEMCYDESYYYDKNIKKSIMEYSLEDGFIKKITIKTKNSNICENEYVLDNNWNNLLDNKISEVEFFKCTDECNSKLVDININKLKEDIKSLDRVENKNDISVEEEDINYLTIYFDNGEIMKIIPYKKDILGIIYIDNNESRKNALYKVEDSDKYIMSLIK